MNRLAKLVAVGILVLVPAGVCPSLASRGRRLGLALRRLRPSPAGPRGEGTKTASGKSSTGSIVGSGKASMLYSPKGDYKNFRFKAEVKINDHGNSGMYFRSPTNGGSFSDGYEAQIDSTHSDPIRTGSIYGFLHIYKQLVPPDTWFTYEVECVDKRLAGTRRAPHQGVGQRRAAVPVHRADQGVGTRAISPFSSTTRAARSRSARSKSKSWTESRQVATYP